MTTIRDGKLLDIMPDSLSSQPEAQAFSAAFSAQIHRIIDLMEGTRIYSAMSELPSDILDILAIELRTPAYSDTFTVGKKRQLVANTLLFYMRMGTPAAVNDIILTIFEDGYIEEWNEYGGQPFHFRAYTNNPAVTEQNVADFMAALAAVKRATAWLDEVILSITTPLMTEYQPMALHEGDIERLQTATL